MKISTIVFDFGGVLIDWNPRYHLNNVFAGKEKEIEYFLNEVCNSKWNHKQDSGRQFDEGIQEVLSRFPEFKHMIESYWSGWENMLKGQIGGTVDIFYELKNSKNYKLLGLTNWSAETFPYAQSKFKFLQDFDSILVSGQEKLAKPDPQFFQLLLDRNKIQAGECVFIDDVEDNISSAKNMGFNCIHFKNPEDLRRNLIKMNILNS